MKKIRLLLSIMALCCFTSLFSQEMSSVSAPNAASVMTFDNVPVSLRTGVPDISIPLYSLHTREKSIAVNLTANYHPFSSSTKSIIGTGWSLPVTACIYRTKHSVSTIPDIIPRPDEEYYRFRRDEYGQSKYDGSDVFQLNAFGISCRFFLKFQDNEISVVGTGVGGNDKIQIIPSYNPNTFEIFSFTMYDKNGNKYVFDKFEGRCVGTSLSHYIDKSVWCLSKVYNANNSEVVSFKYKEPSNGATNNVCGVPVLETQILDSITSKGVGQIYFERYPYSGFKGGLLKRIHIRQPNMNEISSVNFDYYMVMNRVVLNDITTANPNDNATMRYKLQYNEPQDPGVVNYAEVDDFGFFTDNRCMPDPGETRNINPYLRTQGLLNSITFPTGGTVSYEFEPNTYYDDYDSTVEDSVYSSLFHNFTSSEYDSGAPHANPTFYIWQPGYYYVKLLDAYVVSPVGSHGQGFFDENGEPQDVAPGGFCKLDGGYRTLVRDSDNLPVKFDKNHTKENFCDGKKLYLTPGFYSFYHERGLYATYTVRKRTINSALKKWYYGGGVRIKNISYSNGEVDEEGNLVPFKVINYSYNLLEDANKSSGVNNVYTEDFLVGFATANEEPVNYRNVTVRETGKGRTEYNFWVRRDFLDNLPINEVPFSFWKEDLIKSQAVYDEEGKVLSETTNQYVFNTTDYKENWGNLQNGVATPDSTLFSKFGIDGYVSSIISTKKDHFYKPDGTEMISSNSTFSSFMQKNLPFYSIDGYGSDEERQILYEYRYYPCNPEVSQLYSKLTDIKSYRGSGLSQLPVITNLRSNYLINTKRLGYAQFTGNNKYLPSQTTNIKGTQDGQVSFVATKYDEFDNLLEGHMQDGITTSLIYGYNKTQVIAEVVNASYEQIAAALNITVSQLSQLNETQIAQLDSLRTSLPQARVTTYTYIPLVGISTMKDPRGKVTSYYYDGLGRLKQVRDNEGRILTENTYNYQPNQQ